MRQVVLQWTNDLAATLDSMCLRGIRESGWPPVRIAANIAKLPEQLKRNDAHSLADERTLTVLNLPARLRPRLVWTFSGADQNTLKSFH